MLFCTPKQQVYSVGVVEKMRQLQPQSFVPFVYQARIERVLGEKDAAKQVALTAKSLLGMEVSFFGELNLADELHSLGLFAEAGDVYARIAVPERDDRATRALIDSYYRSDQWDKSLECCNRLMKDHQDVQYAVEISSFIHEHTGNLTTAIQVLQQYLVLKPDDQHIRLRLAHVFRRNGKDDEAVVELERIKEPEKLHPQDILHYSSLSTIRGSVELVIKLLYEARRRYSNDPDVEMGYVGAIWAKEKKFLSWPRLRWLRKIQ